MTSLEHEAGGALARPRSGDVAAHRAAPAYAGTARRGSRAEGAGPGWRPSAPAGPVAAVGAVELETGSVLPDVVLAYQTWGTLAPDRSNAVLVLHALTGGTDVRTEDPTRPGWWQDLVGPGLPIDTDRYFVVAPNVLGGCHGSTGPASPAPDGRPYGSRFPVVTVRDQVAAEIQLSAALGIDAWQFVVGGSMGGLRALEWAILGPEAGIDVVSVGVIAATAQSSGDQIAWAHPQLAAIQADPHFHGGDYYDQAQAPTTGLGIARQIAHTTYRSAAELDRRFGRIPQGAEDPLRGGRFAVQSYLDHHAHKLARRFDANSYLVLTESMLTHDLGRDRGGVDTALASIQARVMVAAVESDRLFLPVESARIARHAPRCPGVHTIRSEYGHDGFLIEVGQLSSIIAGFLASLPSS
ncbi:homoserine O-acetyltransferase [Flavimobilis marinus]|uniref:Homoserine O-acetyltransferase n=1 Tax=Flavimobilis marinus TaxID=285351 RepID=A0A1I2GXC9_9MICO|nr:homoserine O-acetyltransferase [Flavimobilis marinus]GHG55141.1 homoserine O-acetyltransferase [Flavimobilis marinus]SFF21437.1 homoserine O-acetyltransferase [Flavimobilis marinus]